MWKLGHNWDNQTGEPPPAPDQLLEDVSELRAALWAKVSGRPYYFTLRSSGSDQFSLFLGGSWGTMDCTWWEADRRYYRMAQPSKMVAPAGVLFEDGGEGVFLSPNRLFPAADVVDAAVYYFEHRVLSPRVKWIGWEMDQLSGRGG